MILHLRLPNQLSRSCIHRVSVGAHIAKKYCELIGAGDRGKTNRGSKKRLVFKTPGGASVFCVKGVAPAIAPANKYQTADNGWLGQCARYTKKSECPFH